jgi:hypothetical protein
VHNYDEFITTFLTMLAEQNLLGDLVQHGLGSKRLAAADREASTAAASATASSSGNMKKHSGGGISKNTSTQPITLPNQPGSSSGSAAAASQPVRNRKKKKKKYEESESDWSDEEALVPVNRGGFIDCDSYPLRFDFLIVSDSDPDFAIIVKSLIFICIILI